MTAPVYGRDASGAMRRALPAVWLALAAASIPVPIPPIPLGPLGTVRIDALRCSELGVGGLDWKYDRPSLALSATGLRASCGGLLSWGLIQRKPLALGLSNGSVGARIEFGFDHGWPSSAQLAPNQCQVAIRLDKVHISGLMGHGLAGMINALRPELERAISARVGTTLERLVNVNLTRALQAVRALRKAPPPQYINWSAALEATEKVPALHNSSAANHAAETLMGLLKGLMLPGVSVGDNGTVLLQLPRPIERRMPQLAVGVSSLELAGLDSFVGPLELISAVGSRGLGSRATMRELAVKVGLVLDYNGSTPVHNAFTVELAMSNLSVDTRASVDLDLSTLLDLSLRQLGRAACLITPIKRVVVNPPEMQLESIRLVLQNQTNIQGFDRMTEMLETAFRPALLKNIVDTVASDLGRKSMLTRLLNKVLADALSSAEAGCNGAAPQSPGSAWEPPAELYGAALVVLIMATGLALRIYRQCELSRISNYAPTSSQFKQEDVSAMARLDRFMDGSLLYQDQISLATRVGVPALLLCDLVLFLSGHCGLGAAVTVKLEYMGQEIYHADAFDFSQWSSVREMWQAEVYALSILVAFCSGVWPYLKAVLVLIAWCAPVAVLSLKSRGRLLEALDALGKWSLVDSFMLVMMMVAFHFRIGLPGGYFGLPSDLVSVETSVNPGWGFYGFVICSLLELPLFAQFILGGRCNIPNDVISVMDHATPPVDIGHGEDKCFDVKTTLEPGCWVLFAAMLIAWLIIMVVTRSAAQATHERLYRKTGCVSKGASLAEVAGYGATDEEQGESRQDCHAAGAEGMLRILGAAKMVEFDACRYTLAEYRHNLVLERPGATKTGSS